MIWLTVLLWILVGLVFGVAGVLVAFMFAWTLAQFNILWTVVREGQAKAVVQNEQFWRAIVSMKGHDFRRYVFPHWRAANRKKLEERREELSIAEADNDKTLVEQLTKEIKEVEAEFEDLSDWDIVDMTPEEYQKRKSWPLFGGLHWTGAPFGRRLHSYRFFWTSLEQKGDERTGKQIAVFKSQEQQLDFILVQQDMYALHLKEAETKDLMGIDLDIVVTLRVINPRRALFGVNKWLETTLNRLASRIREYIGMTQFETLIKLERQVETTPPTEPETDARKKSLSDELKNEVDEDIKFIRRNYGVEIIKLQVFSITASDAPLKTAVQERYRADRVGEGIIATANAEAKAIERKADAEASRFKKLTEALTGLKVDPNIAAGVVQTQVRTENIGGSQVVTYVEGGANTSVMVPTMGATPAPVTTPSSTP